jgi:DNA-binding beta-propeller fold protein YncE
VSRGSGPAGEHVPALQFRAGAGGGPLGIAITPDGMTAWVTNYGPIPGTVTPVNLATNTAGTPITVGTLPHAVAIAGG